MGTFKLLSTKMPRCSMCFHKLRLNYPIFLQYHGNHIQYSTPRFMSLCLISMILNKYIGSINSILIKSLIIWATVNIWYIAPSHQFLKSVLSFLKFWYISICYHVLKSVLSFSKPQLNFQKIKMSRILLSINLNFGCSSYH